MGAGTQRWWRDEQPMLGAGLDWLRRQHALISGEIRRLPRPVGADRRAAVIRRIEAVGVLTTEVLSRGRA